MIIESFIPFSKGFLIGNGNFKGITQEIELKKVTSPTQHSKGHKVRSSVMRVPIRCLKGMQLLMN